MTLCSEQTELIVAAEADFDGLSADEYIAQIRRPFAAHEPVDMVATVAMVGAIVRYAPMPYSGLLGPGAGIQSISLHISDWPCRQWLTAAHELGHYFLDFVADATANTTWGRVDSRPANDSLENAKREAFCTYFGSRLIGVPPCFVGQEWEEL